MKYKALFLDIDDTLLSKSHSLSERNLTAISRAQAAGIFVTIATGRNFLGATPIWQALGVQGPIIVYGGAMAVDTRTGETLYQEFMEPALVHEVLSYADQLGIHAQIYQNNMVIAGGENEFTAQYTATQRLPFQVAEDFLSREWDTPKVLIYVDPAEEARYQALFVEKFQGRLEIACSKPGFIEINSLGHHKGSAILRVAELMGISQEETAAVGDNTLDLEMLKQAGLGTCVANGNELAKAAADIIIPACDEDGVAWFIEHYLLEG